MIRKGNADMMGHRSRTVEGSFGSWSKICFVLAILTARELRGHEYVCVDHKM